MRVSCVIGEPERRAEAVPDAAQLIGCRCSGLAAVLHRSPPYDTKMRENARARHREAELQLAAVARLPADVADV